jgi:hypothetical protein
MSNVLKVNKRRKDLLFAIQGFFEKGYWRLEFERDEEVGSPSPHINLKSCDNQ